MKKVGVGLVKTAVVILIVACANSTLADSVFDHFDDEMLDPAWQIIFDNSLGWMYSEAGTLLTVTDIDIIDQSSAPARSHVLLSQKFLAPADFTIKGTIAWDSGGNNSAMQGIFIRLRSGGGIIVSAGYHDSAPAYRGEKAAIIGGAFFYSGLNSLPLSGSANIRIERIADEVSIFWDDVLILNAVENRAIDEVAVIFRKNTYDSRSTFGELAIDYIWANSEKVQLTDLRIVGPNEVAEESVTQYTAIAVYDNNSTKDVTDSATWAVMPDNYADIDDSGLLSTYELVMPIEEVTIYAEYTEGNDVVQAEKDVQIFALCPQSSALEFDGVNDYINCPDPPDGSLDFGTCPFSVSAWVYLYSDQNHKFVTKVETAANEGWALRINFGQLQFVLNDSYVVNASQLPLNSWCHIVGVRTATGLRLYVDGQNVANSDEGVGQNVSTPYPLQIGWRYGSRPSVPHHGIIDDVAIYSCALSAAQINALMYHGPELTDSNLAGFWDFAEGQGQIAHDSSGNANHGYLGSDPCNPNDSDPCWVEPGAPLYCTPRQMIVRNIEGVLERKRIAQQQIDEALERERASVRLLMDDMKGYKSCCRNPWNILWPAREIYRSMHLEYQCRRKLQESTDILERALKWLLNDAVPGLVERPRQGG